MLRIFPDLDEDLLLDLFHRGAKAQWTSRDVDWDVPLQLAPPQREALARLLTPTYLGEQTAMLGASAIVPQLAAAGETTAQLYLTTFMLDEARHFEALTRVYRALGHEPMRLRDMPDMLRYHHRLRSGDRLDWVWGILISDLYAKNFYRVFAASQPQALFGQMSARILQDESRHLAFALTYLGRAVPKLEPARRQALVTLRDDLYRLIQGGLERLHADCETLHLDHHRLEADLWRELEQAGRRIGLDGDGEPDEQNGPRPNGRGAEQAPVPEADAQPAQDADERVSASGDGRQRARREDDADARASAPGATPSEPVRARARRFFAVDLPKCFGCLLLALCRPRPAAG
jgi:hypothetical protein